MAQKILYLVSEDWYFVSHRLPMARSAQRAGYEVHVATRIGNCSEKIRHEGSVLHPIQWRRGSLNPIRLLAAVIETRRLYRQIRPDLVHHVAVADAGWLVGSTRLSHSAAECAGGFGFCIHFKFRQGTRRATDRRVPSALAIETANTTVLVQNPDDQSVVIKLGVPNDKIAVIPGSGVDIDSLTQMPEPPGPLLSDLLDACWTTKACGHW